MRAVYETSANSTVHRPGGSRSGRLHLAGLAYVFFTPLDVVQLSVGSPARLAGAVFLLVWMLELLVGRVVLPHRGGVRWVLVALIGWSFLTVSWSYSPDISMSQATTTALLALSAVAVGSTFADRVDPALFALALGSSLAGLAAIVSGPEVAVGSQQSTFLGVDQNALAFALTLGLAASLSLIHRSTSRRRAAAIVFTVILLTAQLAVGSRTGVGAAIAMLLVSLARSPSSPRRVARAAVGAAALGAAVWLASSWVTIPSRVGEWITNPTFSDSREDIIGLYRLQMDDWILTGVGAGADAEYLRSSIHVYLNAHNAMWKVWIELGFVGLALWTLFAASIARLMWRSSERGLFLLFAIPIVFFFYTLSPLNSNSLWVVFGLAMGAGSTRMRPGAHRVRS